jgi:Ni,Fe-hydrogenase III small subunit/ferredoxin
MPWIPRGLREGVVTTRYPRRLDDYGAEFRGAVCVVPGSGTGPDRPALRRAAEECPTDAITLGAAGPRLDRGRCILCGRCVHLAPEAFRFDPAFETASVGQGALVVPVSDEDDVTVAAARRELARRVRALRRSVHVRHVDAGSDGSDEWEVAALTNPVYDVHRLGIFFTASPKHADLLLATGAGSAGMTGPLRHTFDVMPEPKVVVAAGVDAISGGLVGEGYAVRGGVSDAVPVDVLVPGSPPSPFGLLYGILLAVGLLEGATGERARMQGATEEPGT